MCFSSKILQEILACFAVPEKSKSSSPHFFIIDREFAKLVHILTVIRSLERSKLPRELACPRFKSSCSASTMSLDISSKFGCWTCSSNLFMIAAFFTMGSISIS
ncbi:hypothetical protein Droror1_Dr00025322 [Drosera rotundifolia]